MTGKFDCWSRREPSNDNARNNVGLPGAYSTGLGSSFGSFGLFKQRDLPLVGYMSVRNTLAGD